MSYEKERVELIKKKHEMTPDEQEFDAIWLKMKNMADSFNRSVDIGNHNHVEGLNPAYFEHTETLLDMLRTLNKPIFKGKQPERIYKFDEEYLCTMPTTFPDLLKYFFYYQDLVDDVYCGNFERYEMRNNHLVICEFISFKKPVFAKCPDKKQPLPTPKQTVPIEVPELSEESEQDFYLKIPPKATLDNFRERKDCQPLYDKVNGYYIEALMPLYLSSLINYIGNSHRIVREDVPFRKYEDGSEDHPASYYENGKKGRGDFLSTKEGLFLIIFKQQIANVSMGVFLSQDFEKIRAKHYLKRSKYDGNVLTRFMRTAYIKDILRDMMIESVADVLPYETNYAIDGSGFDASSQNDWYGFKHHVKKEHDWMYIVALVPTKSDVVALANLYYKYESDETKEFKLIMEEVQQRQIEIRSLCGDKLYSTVDFHNWMGELGIQFFTEFKSDVSPPLPEDDSQWAKDYRFWKEHPEEFSAKYHTRSNVESTFSAIKNRCGEKLRSKTEGGFYSELFSKIIYYNLCHMILELFMNGIVPRYVSLEDIQRELEGMKEFRAKKKEQKEKEKKEYEEHMESKKPKYIEEKKG